MSREMPHHSLMSTMAVLWYKVIGFVGLKSYLVVIEY